LVNDLAGLIKLFFDLGFGALQSGLAKVYGISEKRTSGVDAAAVAPVLEVDSFGFEELA